MCTSRRLSSGLSRSLHALSPYKRHTSPETGGVGVCGRVSWLRKVRAVQHVQFLSLTKLFKRNEVQFDLLLRRVRRLAETLDCDVAPDGAVVSLETAGLLPRTACVWI